MRKIGRIERNGGRGQSFPHNQMISIMRWLWDGGLFALITQVAQEYEWFSQKSWPQSRWRYSMTTNVGKIYDWNIICYDGQERRGEQISISPCSHKKVKFTDERKKFGLTQKVFANVGTIKIKLKKFVLQLFRVGRWAQLQHSAMGHFGASVRAPDSEDENEGD